MVDGENRVAARGVGLCQMGESFCLSNHSRWLQKYFDLEVVFEESVLKLIAL